MAAISGDRVKFRRLVRMAAISGDRVKFRRLDNTVAIASRRKITHKIVAGLREN
jgi:hypothetical protein